MLDYPVERRLTGGIRLIGHKAESTARPILRGVVPAQLVLALGQHGGASAEPVVSVGETVLKGQLVAKPGPLPSAAVHASSSGRVRSIEERLIPAGNRLAPSLCIVIDTDGEHRAVSGSRRPWPAGREARLERVLEGGLAGLGGAAFPTAAKLQATSSCKALIVNGAECEPYISCDDMLMREAPAEVVSGALLMCELVDAPVCIIAIERDKPQALKAIHDAAAAAADARLKIAELPTIYPAGGERQLIEVLTGEEIPSGAFPSAIGYLCQNVGTAYALHRLARYDEPLTTRIVSVTGRGVVQPQNVEAPIGTPIGHLIELCGGYRPDADRLIHGGSMMGYALPSDDLPVTKATSSVIAAVAEEIRSSFEEWACIRCADCSMVCPARLMPQDLLTAAGADDFTQLHALGLEDCIECGCCDVVCPSHIALTQRFRAAKRAFAKHVRMLEISAESDERYRRRERRRSSSESQAREAQDALRAQLRADDEARRKAIEAAVDRAKRRRGREES